MKNLRRCWGSFHPLYRGTWTPTRAGQLAVSVDIAVSIRYIAVLGLQPDFALYLAMFILFQSAISRYLVSNDEIKTVSSFFDSCFNPLYRGTWFPTLRSIVLETIDNDVSIRYIAVLGFQPADETTTLPPGTVFQSAISRYLVSNVAATAAALVLTAGAFVSIRYIAVLGFQRSAPKPTPSSSKTVSIRYIAVLGFQLA